MSEGNRLNASQEALLDAWKRTLPETLNPGDSVELFLDQADNDALRIHIEVAGRTGYSFDFKVKYVDDREVEVSLVDAEREGVTVDERTETIQNLIEDYVRHIHECAQALHTLTHQ